MPVQQKYYLKLQTNAKFISFPTMITPLMFNGIYISTEHHANNYINIISSSNTYLLIRTINH